jgi:hypothetical protein
VCYPSCYCICGSAGTKLSSSLHSTHTPQLHFALTDAAHWMSHYNGFNYEEFYEFVIDFFEADATTQAQEASAKLLEWWNKYVFGSIPISTTADVEYSPERSFQGPQPHAQPHLCQDDEHPSRSCDNNVRLPVHPTRPRSSLWHSERSFVL